MYSVAKAFVAGLAVLSGARAQECDVWTQEGGTLKFPDFPTANPVFEGVKFTSTNISNPVNKVSVSMGPCLVDNGCPAPLYSYYNQSQGDYGCAGDNITVTEFQTAIQELTLERMQDCYTSGIDGTGFVLPFGNCTSGFIQEPNSTEGWMFSIQ